MPKIIVLLLSLIISFSYSYSQKKLRTKKVEYNVLFVGNSLTYTNNLPQLVEQSALKMGIKINTKIIAQPNYAIIDHWADGQIQKLILNDKFDYVIIQQGPSSQEDGRKMLIEDGKKISDLCTSNGAKLCYFMVWPSLNYLHTFDGVISNHVKAAAINKSILLPVGRVWKEYIDNTKRTDYYGSDGFHPSLKGSKKAADVIVEHLFIQ